MKSVKIIEGKAFMCEEIATNPSAKRTYIGPVYNLKFCMDAVSQRMTNCLARLEEAVQQNSVYNIDGCVIYHAKGAFNTRAYEIMESLLTKLEEKAETVQSVEAVWFENHLSVREADQLFKAYVSHTSHFEDCEMRLWGVVVALRDQGVGNPSKTVLRTYRKHE